MARFQTALAFLCFYLFVSSFKNQFKCHAFFLDNETNSGEVPVRDYEAMTGFGAARRHEARHHLPQEIPVDLEVCDDVLALVDRLIEPQTINHFFLESLMLGNLPDGTKSTLPLFTEKEAELFGTPYSFWAPKPFHKLPDSVGDRLMIRVGSYEDGDRMVVVEKNVHAMKSRLWEGIIPISDTRWRQKNLDDPKNHVIACQHLTLVIDVFTYLNKPSVYYRLRETYNLMYAELQKFDKAINALRAQSGDAVTINTAARWLEFIIAHFRNMTTRAHAFVLSHIERMRIHALEELSSLPGPGFEPLHLQISDRLHDLTEIMSAADYGIIISLDGWKGYTTPASNATCSILQRREKYFTDLKHNTRRKAYIDSFGDSLEDGGEHSYSESLVKVSKRQIEAQEEVRLEMRGAKAELGIVSWVSNVIYNLNFEEDPDLNWGFVAYRLSYTETEEEWACFKQKLEEDAAQWSEGIPGSEDIKNKAKIQWLNGQDLGIAEGDTVAAKVHFATFKATPSLIQGITPLIFLAADSLSIASFLFPSPIPDEQQTPGDFRGYIIAVDADFDPEAPNEHEEESPGFTGEVRILGSLVYGDLWAMATEALYQNLESLWPLARVHPAEVYVGPNVRGEREVWGEVVKVV